MATAIKTEIMPALRMQGSIRHTAFILGVLIPVLGTLLIEGSLPNWRWQSMPLHSSLEVGGAVLGLLLVIIILFSRQMIPTTRRMWVACALTSMAVLDIWHSCVPAGNSFVWLHSLAVLAGGVFFALVWFPEHHISRATATTTAATVALVSLMIGFFSVLYPRSIPVMIVDGSFTSSASAINLIGGGLTLLAALNFTGAYHRTKNREELIFTLLCLLFGGAGALFRLSDAWEAAWWFWHLLRLVAYGLALWLAVFSYRSSENEMIRAQKELDGLFLAAVDGKRVVDQDFTVTRVNDTFIQLTGMNKEALEKKKCFEMFRGPLCQTDECPLKVLERGTEHRIQQEVVKTRQDGKEMICILNATRRSAADGSFRGIIESYWDITDRKIAEDKLMHQAQQKSAQAELVGLMKGDLKTDQLCRNVITFLCKYLKAQTGVIYLVDQQGTFNLIASYAHKRRKHLANAYKPGEGLVGQAALEREEIVLTNVPEDYFVIESGLGEVAPRHIFVKPVIYNEKVVAVIELGSLEAFTDSHSQFLDIVTENIAAAIDSAKSRLQLADALVESQNLSERLQAQQEELRVTNEELEAQTHQLQASEEELKSQQEALQVTNEELEEKTLAIEEQKEQVENKNRALEQIQKDLEEKAKALEMSSLYKSEFLANMSHELRTPLNSLLILSKDLLDNKKDTLDHDQLESAAIIHRSGQDLLSLINEILDLSKIEAGMMELHMEDVPLADMLEIIQTGFRPVLDKKGLSLNLQIEPGMPETILTDRKRLEQVLKNLVSNAVKFTEKGSISLSFHQPRKSDHPKIDIDPHQYIAVSVADTGIGIDKSKQHEIFEAFQQGDGSVSRKYGGTGLGLSISKELIRLLGGEIHLKSTENVGSTFTVYLPRNHQSASPQKQQPASSVVNIIPANPEPMKSQANIPDDRLELSEKDRVILVIEDDHAFAGILMRMCHDRQFKCIHAADGESGLQLAETHKPDAVMLDLHLPGIGGWRVLEIMKSNSGLRHIPVHIMSVEKETIDAYKKGAIGFVEKPATKDQLQDVFRKITNTIDKKIKRLLIVEDDETLRESLVKLIGNGDVSTNTVATGEAALKEIESTDYDCVILDLNLPDITGFEVLNRLNSSMDKTAPPFIVYTGRDLTREEIYEIEKYTTSIIVKGARSQERLLDETALFLHRVIDHLPSHKKTMITSLYEENTVFQGKKVLVTDDDMRNVFAVSRVLEERGMIVHKAADGEKALQLLNSHPDIDLVLMDIMMPVMDGYETIRRIRAQKRFQNLPILAVTAKAMKDDRGKCMSTGANDYISKPIDVDRLISLIRVWLYK